jgi:hypothetical protein
MIDTLRHAGRLRTLSRYHRGLLDGSATRWDATAPDVGGRRIERWRWRPFDVGGGDACRAASGDENR